jgi:3D (Asp-Asp-Asp) domain-containing protein
VDTNIKKIIAALTLVFQFAILVPATGAESMPMEKRKLLVTAYYSPLPDQDFYIRGSYEADIRLNGRGTNGADGTEVYVGMLAAPRTYPFGTRVSIPGLGVGEVHDRGGAILAGKDYDRIDVWMGHGEEGLARALNWGARVVEGEVYFTAHQVEPGLSFGWVSSTLPEAFVQRLKNKSVKPSNTVSDSAPVTAPKTVTTKEKWHRLFCCKFLNLKSESRKYKMLKI